MTTTTAIVERQTSLVPAPSTKLENATSALARNAYEAYLHRFRAMPVEELHPHAALYLHLNPKWPQINPEFCDAMELVKIERRAELQAHVTQTRALEREAQLGKLATRHTPAVGYVPTETDLHDPSIDLTALGYVWGGERHKSGGKGQTQIAQLWVKQHAAA